MINPILHDIFVLMLTFETGDVGFAQWTYDPTETRGAYHTRIVPTAEEASFYKSWREALLVFRASRTLIDSPFCGSIFGEDICERYGIVKIEGINTITLEKTLVENPSGDFMTEILVSAEEFAALCSRRTTDYLGGQISLYVGDTPKLWLPEDTPISAVDNIAIRVENLRYFWRYIGAREIGNARDRTTDVSFGENKLYHNEDIQKAITDLREPPAELSIRGSYYITIRKQ